MFRLPVCPHCGTVYRYKDTKTAIKNKNNICYHCGKSFRAKIFPDIIVGALIPLAVCILINIFLLSRMKEAMLLPLFAVTLFFILIIYIIVPFFTRFGKNEENSKESNRKRRN